MSRFSELTQDPVIEVFELTRQFNEDTFPNKVITLNYFYFHQINNLAIKILVGDLLVNLELKILQIF